MSVWPFRRKSKRATREAEAALVLSKQAITEARRRREEAERQQQAFCELRQSDGFTEVVAELFKNGTVRRRWDDK